MDQVIAAPALLPQAAVLSRVLTERGFDSYATVVDRLASEVEALLAERNRHARQLADLQDERDALIGAKDHLIEENAEEFVARAVCDVHREYAEEALNRVRGLLARVEDCAEVYRDLDDNPLVPVEDVRKAMAPPA